MTLGRGVVVNAPVGCSVVPATTLASARASLIHLLTVGEFILSLGVSLSGIELLVLLMLAAMRARMSGLSSIVPSPISRSMII